MTGSRGGSLTTSTTTASGRVRIEALTGLRFFAAFAVFLHHTAQPQWLPQPISLVMAAGSNGVTFFFVLSGFVIALNYFEDAAQPTGRRLWNYAVSRLARVYPLYLLVLTVVWILADGHTYFARYVWQALALQTWHPSLAVAYGINPPGWSIGVEFFLYACFPLLVLALRPIAAQPRKLIVVGLILFALLCALTTWFQLTRYGLPASDPTGAHRWLYRTPATRLVDFTLGVIVALLLGYIKRRWKESKTRDRFLAPALTWLPLIATLAMMTWPDRTYYYATLDVLWLPPALAICLGLGLYPDSAAGRLLGWRPVVLLGEISFAFYLVHRPLMWLFRVQDFTTDRPVVYVAKVAAVLLLITGVAVGCHFLWEKPAQRLINRKLRLAVPPRTTGVQVPSVPRQATAPAQEMLAIKPSA
jgi:peptidoglycan/LPS O-acetylase OafA/YrhL